MQTTTTKAPSLFTDEKTAEVAMKNERVLIYEDTKTIQHQERVTKDRLPSLNAIRREYLKLKIGEPTIGDIQFLISNADDRNDAKERVSKYIVNKPSFRDKKIEASGFTITLSKAVEKGLIDLPEIDIIFNIAASTREDINRRANDGFSYNLIEQVNGEFVLNQSKMEDFRNSNRKYISTEKEKEKWEAFKAVTDGMNNLIEKGFMKPENFKGFDNRFFLNDNGKFRPNHGNIFLD